VRERVVSSASLAVQAIEEAEEALVGLPQTAAVRVLQGRVQALKTVLYGLIREVPRLSDAQRAKAAEEALVLSREAIELRQRLLSPESP
jgi:hypothetical protein